MAFSIIEQREDSGCSESPQRDFSRSLRFRPRSICARCIEEKRGFVVEGLNMETSNAYFEIRRDR
jgi:hypothetical protein